VHCFSFFFGPDVCRCSQAPALSSSTKWIDIGYFLFAPAPNPDGQAYTQPLEHMSKYTKNPVNPSTIQEETYSTKSD
jgi:hypothetical protein